MRYEDELDQLRICAECNAELDDFETAVEDRDGELHIDCAEQRAEREAWADDYKYGEIDEWSDI